MKTLLRKRPVLPIHWGTNNSCYSFIFSMQDLKSTQLREQLTQRKINISDVGPPLGSPEARLWDQDVWASSLLGWQSQDCGEWGKEGKEANIGYCPTLWTTRISSGLVLLAEAKKYALESSNGRRERAGAFVHQFPFVFFGLLVGGDHG